MSSVFGLVSSLSYASCQVPIDLEYFTSICSVLLDILRHNETTISQETLQWIHHGCIVPLLKVAQRPQRHSDFKPVNVLITNEILAADSALMCLGEFASLATTVLKIRGWEIDEDDKGMCLYVHVDDQITQHLPPSLDFTAEYGTGISLIDDSEIHADANAEIEVKSFCGGSRNFEATSNTNICKADLVISFDKLGKIDAHKETSLHLKTDDITSALQHLLEMPLVIAPYVKGASIIWPISVVYASSYLSILDITDHEENTTRQMVIGAWKGISGFRETEVDLSYPLGLHLENWYTCMLAGICLTELNALKKPSPSVLVVGLGGGSLPAFLKMHHPMLSVSVVEVSKQVCVSAITHFKFEGYIQQVSKADGNQETLKTVKGGCEIYIDDISHFAKVSKKKFDVILLDVYTSGSFPSSLKSVEFFQDLKRILNFSDGLIALNAGTDVDLNEIIQFLDKKKIYRDYSSGEDENVIVRLGGHHNLGFETWKSTVTELECLQAEILFEKEALRIPFKLENIRTDKAASYVKWGLYEGEFVSKNPEAADCEKLDATHADWDIFS